MDGWLLFDQRWSRVHGAGDSAVVMVMRQVVGRRLADGSWRVVSRGDLKRPDCSGTAFREEVLVYWQSRRWQWIGIGAGHGMAFLVVY